MINKKVFTFLIFSLVISLMFGYDITYRYIFYNGETVSKTIDSYTETLVLNAPYRGVKRIEGLQQLQNVRELRLFNLEASNLDFIGEFNQLEEIHFNNIKPNNFKMLNNSKNLNVISIKQGLGEELTEKVLNNLLIDLRGFDNLELLIFEGFTPGLTKVPNFLVTNNKVKLSITNSNIKSFTKEDIEVLKQFNTVDISYSPVCSNRKELQKLDDAQIVYIADSKMRLIQ